MKIDDSGLVLDKGFEHATAIVKEAFASRGFVVTTMEVGHEPNAARPQEPRRYLHLRAVLPELTFEGAESTRSSMLGCKLSVVELNGASTLVAADPPLVSYPLLSRLIPRVTQGIDQALARLTRHVAIREAA